MGYETLNLIGAFLMILFISLMLLMCFNWTRILPKYGLKWETFQTPIVAALLVTLLTLMTATVASALHPVRAEREQCRVKVMKTVEVPLQECQDLGKENVEQ
jgi:hypothetical protein